MEVNSWDDLVTYQLGEAICNFKKVVVNFVVTNERSGVRWP